MPAWPCLSCYSHQSGDIVTFDGAREDIVTWPELLADHERGVSGDTPRLHCDRNCPVCYPPIRWRWVDRYGPPLAIAFAAAMWGSAVVWALLV